MTTAIRHVQGAPPQSAQGNGLASSVGALGARALWPLFALGLCVAIVAPIATFFARAFTDGGSAFERLGQTPDIGQTLATTVILAACGTTLGAVIALGLSVAVSRVSARLRPVAAVIPLLPLVVPPIAFVYGWIFIFDSDVGYGNHLLRKLPFWQDAASGPVNVYSFAGIVVVTAIEVSAIIFAFVDARFREINGTVEAAARVAGATPFKSFLTITFPLLRPALIAGVVVAFLLQLGQFTAPLFLGARSNIDVITTEIFRLREQYPVDYPLTAVLGLPLLVFGVVAILLQRRVIGDQRKYVTLGSGRGVETKSSPWASLTCVGYGVVCVGLPIAATALVAFSPYWHGDLSNMDFSFNNVRQALDDPRIVAAIVNTLKASILASLIVTILGFLGALVLSGVAPAPAWCARMLDFVFIAPLAVPRAVLGMLVLFVFIRPPFYLYGTLTIYVIGYIFVTLPFSMRSQYSSLIGAHSSMFEASRICGANQLRTVLGIAVPTAFRGMVASIALAFILLSNDVAVSLMIQAPGAEVVGTKLYALNQAGTVTDIAVLSLIMTAITAAIVAMTLFVAGRKALENL